MGKSLLEELQAASVSNDEAYVEYFNNGIIRTEKHRADKRMTPYQLDDTISTIEYVFSSGAETFARNCSYDKITLGLEIGLLFNKEDVDDENNIKENAEPIENIVHCYTGDITSYLNDEQSNERDYNNYHIQGFVDYDTLVSTMKENGLTFDGPENFVEFKEQILSGNNFDISLVADLKAKKEEKEEIKVEVKEEPKKLVKKTFFGRRK